MKNCFLLKALKTNIKSFQYMVHPARFFNLFLIHQHHLGGSSSTFSKGRAWLYKYPTESMQLLDSITNITINYLVGQVKAGAQMLQVGYIKSKKIKSSLFSWHYAKACNEWRDPSPRLCAWTAQKYGSDGESLATLCPIWQGRELKAHLPHGCPLQVC